MKRLSLSSVYKILLFIIASLFIKNNYINFVLFIILILDDYRKALVYILALILVNITFQYRSDFIKYGIVEYKVNDYYVIDKLIYKTKTNDTNINIGDIVLTNQHSYLNEDNYLKKNILYQNDSIEVLNTIKIKKCLYNRINSYTPEVSSILNKLFYNVNDYNDDSYSMYFSLVSYYFLKRICKKNRKLGITLLIFNSIVFYFDIKFVFILIDCIKKENKFFNKISIILFINYKLILNYSIFYTLLIELFNNINISSDFKLYNIFISSLMFGEINLLRVFFYKYFYIYETLIYLLSFPLLIFKNLSNLYLKVVQMYVFIQNISFTVRGKISLLSVILYIVVLKRIKIENYYIKYIVLLFILISPLNNPLFHISFIDVGQGDSILIKNYLNMGNILIDTGSEYNYYKLKKYLFSEGIYKIDYLLITHDDSDHNGNINNLKNDFKISKIIDYPIDIKFRNLFLKNLYTGTYSNDNDNSLVYFMNVNDLRFLFTGDISKNVEKRIINEYSAIECDILKVSHHGSKTGSSEYFISNLSPKIAIISTSGQYNHPSKQTLDTLERYGIQTYITKNDGNIVFYFSKCINYIKTNILDFAIIISDDIHN